MNTEYIKKLAEEMKKEGMDAVLLTPSAEMDFFIGFTPMSCERFQGLFIKSDATFFYVCNLIYSGEFKSIFPDTIPVYTWFDGEDMAEVVGGILEKQGLKKGSKIGVDASCGAFNILDLAKYTGIEFVSGKAIIEEVRIHKTHEELDALRASAHLVDEVFTEVCDFVKPGMKEQDVADFLTERMAARGGYDIWTIVACGPNGSYPHYCRGDRVIAEKDVLLMDFGCTLNKLCSDMTRTIFIGGITEREELIYNLVREANESAEALACEGAWIPDLDAKAREVLDKHGYAHTLVNRLGHGIGYLDHEQPEIKQSNKRRLERGNAFSIEPGIYLEGDIGIRIEDIVIINEQGEREVINKSTHDIIIIK